MDRHYKKPKANVVEQPRRPGVVVEHKRARTEKPRRQRRGKKPIKDKQWVIQKKEYQRKQGREVQSDSKFTGRKRKDRF